MHEGSWIMKNTKTESFGSLFPKHTQKNNTGRSTAWEKRLLRNFMRVVGEPPLTVTLWDGTKIHPSRGQARASIVLNDRGALWRLMVNPIMALGDLYAAGRVDSDGSLVELVATLLRARKPYATRSLLERTYVDGLRRLQKNTPSRNRDNIHHHYDLGNDFFRLWLDQSMIYTCAYFPDPNMTLEAAQIAKMDHVCRKLRLRPGERVVEAGCGWGGLALHMARHYGVTVKAYNVSHEQILAARQTANDQGLAGQVEFVEDDFHNIQGEYDAFVSVGMLEHVGLSNYETLGGIIERVLTPTGRGLIHSIGQNQPQPMTGWIEKRIFPGAYPPTLGQMIAIFQPYNFTVHDIENLRPHYAKTCEHWLTRYEDHAAQIETMFDEQFVRMWRFYLSCAIAGFKAGVLQLYQILFTRKADDSMPWSRAFMYPQTGPDEGH